MTPHKTAVYTDYVPHSKGFWTISASDTEVLGISFRSELSDYQRHRNPISSMAVQQLTSYFEGALKSFDLPLHMESYSAFYQQVWQQLLKVPFGQTVSYSDVAIAINNPKAVRAVGLANGRNPYAIVVPCHRIIGKNNKLTGYAHGLELKKELLQHEGALREELTLF